MLLLWWFLLWLSVVTNFFVWRECWHPTTAWRQTVQFVVALSLLLALAWLTMAGHGPDGPKP